MHEMGLMTEIITLLDQSARQNKIAKITRVNLVVGKMTAALPDALQLAFEALKTEDLFSPQAELEIEERETVAQCLNCGNSFTVPDNYLFICPACQSLKVKITSGRELYIAGYEGEENEI